MPLDEWWDRTPKGLVELRRSFGAGTPDAIAVDRIIEWKIAEADAEGSAKLVSSTDKLVGATQRLGTMTLWLVGGTVLLGLAAATDVFLKLMKGVH